MSNKTKNNMNTKEEIRKILKQHLKDEMNIYECKHKKTSLMKYYNLIEDSLEYAILMRLKNDNKINDGIFDDIIETMSKDSKKSDSFVDREICKKYITLCIKVLKEERFRFMTVIEEYKRIHIDRRIFSVVNAILSLLMPIILIIVLFKII